MSNKTVSLEVVNPNAAGIDIGSRSHWVAVGQDSQDVKEFGVYTDDYKAMAKWLHRHNVSTITMESTGTFNTTTKFPFTNKTFGTVSDVLRLF
jgi:hypothetical protein